MTSVETPSATDRECPRCGSAAGPLQEYCLECGARLPPEAGRAGRDAPWLWPVAVTALIAFLAAGIIVTFQLVTDEERPTTIAATSPLPSVPETTSPLPTETLPTAPEPTVPTETAATTPPPPPRNRIVSWPAGTRGWTVVLESPPAAQGRAAATTKAREASQAGLTEVGVLRSDEYSSLHPGYLVVFSGIYDSRAQAEQGASQARNRGYDGAYAREIVP
jgi:hypothetical protein